MIFMVMMALKERVFQALADLRTFFPLLVMYLRTFSALGEGVQEGQGQEKEMIYDTI